MIHNLDDMKAWELRDTVKIQMEEFKKLQAENERLTKLINNHYKIIEHNCKKVIADLEEENERLRQERDHFDTINTELYNMIFSFLDGYPLNDEIDHHDIIKAFENHNLEQQAKGIEDAKEYAVNSYDWDWENVSAEDFSHLLTHYIEQLRNQAKEQSK